MSALPELLRQLALNLVVTVVGFQFPDVPTLSTQQLSQWLDGSRPAPVLIDTREPGEYAVSHLPGALNLTSATAIEAAAIPMKQPIVVYCSIGLRSAALARQLQGLGYRKVYNLEGSIFQWQKQGLPLVANGTPANKVHPFDDLWGALLNPSVVSYR